MRTRSTLLMGCCVAAGVSLFASLVLAVVSPRLGADLAARADRLSRERTGLPLSFASPPSLRVLPPGLRFEAVCWGSDKDGFSVTARGGFASLDALSLLRGAPTIGELRLESPVLRSSAAHTAPALAAPEAPVSGGPAAATAPDTARRAARGTRAARPPLRVARLIVSDGALVHEAGDGERWEMRGVHLTFQTPGRGSLSDLLCDFTLRHRLPGGGLTEASVALRASGSASLPTIALSRCQFTLTPISGPFPRDLGPARVSLIGSADLDAGAFTIDRCDVTLPQARLELSGRGTLSPLSFEGDASAEAGAGLAELLPLPAGGFEELRLAGRASLLNGVLHLPALTGRLDATPLDGFLALSAARRHIRAAIHAPHADLDRLFGGAPAGGDDSTLRPVPALQTEARPEGESGGFSMELGLTADSATWRDMQLTDLKLALTERDGHYRADRIIARTERGGLISARGDYDAPAARWSSSGEAYSVPLPPLLRAAGLLPAASTATMPGTRADRGTVSASWNLAGYGRDLAGAVESMSGSGQVVLRWVGTGAIRRILGRHPQWKGLPDAIGRVRAPFTVSYGVGRWEADLAGDRLSGTGYGSFDNLRRTLDARIFLDVLGVRLPLTIAGGQGKTVARVDQSVLLGQLGKAAATGKRGAARGGRALSAAERRLLLPLLPASERRRFQGTGSR